MSGDVPTPLIFTDRWPDIDQMRADAALGRAWRRCEAARPASSLVTLQGYPDWSPPDYSAATVLIGRLGGETYSDGARCSGPTPTAALNALTDKLEAKP